MKFLILLFISFQVFATELPTSKQIDQINASGGVIINIPTNGAWPIANGGTNNGSLSVTPGGTLYTDGNRILNVGAGSSGQFLMSNGSAAPAWASVSVSYAQEVPSGSINGTNTDFTISHTPVSTPSLVLFEDGLSLVPTTDYSLTGSTITLVIAPKAGQSLVAFYTY